MSNSPRVLCNQAENCLKPHRFFSFFSGRQSYDEAADLYLQAANQYKIRKDWRKAFETFHLAANAAKQAKDNFRVASLYTDAGHCAKKYSLKDASQSYQDAIDIYSNCGKFNQSAKLFKLIAEMFEEVNDSQSISFYKKAAEYFEMEEFGKSQQSACLLKYAHLTSLYDNNLNEAIKIFEEEAQKSLRNSLLQYSAKDYLFKAGILNLVKGNMRDTSSSITHYSTIDPRFKASREEKLLREIIDAIQSNDLNHFTRCITEYDSLKRLEPWHVHFFSKIQEQFDVNSNTTENVTQLAEQFDNLTSLNLNNLTNDDIDLS